MYYKYLAASEVKWIWASFLSIIKFSYMLFFLVNFALAQVLFTVSWLFLFVFMAIYYILFL